MVISYSELVPPISIGLPNGTNIQAHTTGRVILYDKLVLERVMNLPGFKINLIYVSILSEKNNGTIVFEDDSCIIQERGTIKRIGLAKLMDDLYYLKLSQVKLCDSVHIVDSELSRLWNLRLGHLSDEKTKCLNKKYSYILVFDHVSCDVCHMEKQNKFSVVVSDSNAKPIFT